MRVERIADEAWVFSSATYAQVNASLVVTRSGSILIDTLPFPTETREIQLFVRRRGLPAIQYVINTHSHADHSYGNHLFPTARVIASQEGRRWLEREGEASLRAAKEENALLSEVVLRLPDVTVDLGGGIHLGGKNLKLIATPGHSADMVSVLLEEDRILFAGDAVMPVPYIVGGDLEKCKESLRKIRQMYVENIVQGHGEVLLRGEIPEVIDAGIAYLDKLRDRVRQAIDMGMSPGDLRRIDIEECGLSRVPLGGLVQGLHQANVRFLYDEMTRGSSGGDGDQAEMAAREDEGQEKRSGDSG